MDQLTTTLTFELPSVILGDTKFGAQFWTIPFNPLLLQDDAHPVTSANPAVPVFDPNYNWGRIQPFGQPPTPNWIPNAVNADTESMAYWEEMGRYLWYFLISDSHH